MTSTRYSAVRYKVHLVPDGKSLHEAFPELFKNKAFAKLKQRPDCDALVRYVIYLYDKGTELTIEFQNDLKARKEEAARDAGFKKTSNWAKSVQDVMEIRDRDATEAIMEYLKMQNNLLWTEICVCEQELFDYQTLRFTPVTKKKKNADTLDDKAVIEATTKKDALQKACDTRIKLLKGYYAEFYGDHLDVKEAEFTEMIRPETAERILAEMPAPYEEIKN